MTNQICRFRLEVTKKVINKKLMTATLTKRKRQCLNTRANRKGFWSFTTGTGCTTDKHGALQPHTPAPKPTARGYSPLWGPRFVSQKVIELQSRHELCSSGGVGRFSPLDSQRGSGAGVVFGRWCCVAHGAKAQPPATEVCKGASRIQACADGVHAQKVQARTIELPWAIGRDNVGRR